MKLKRHLVWMSLTREISVRIHPPFLIHPGNVGVNQTAWILGVMWLLVDLNSLLIFPIMVLPHLKQLLNWEHIPREVPVNNDRHSNISHKIYIRRPGGGYWIFYFICRPRGWIYIDKLWALGRIFFIFLQFSGKCGQIIWCCLPLGLPLVTLRFLLVVVSMNNNWSFIVWENILYDILWCWTVADAALYCKV